MKKYTYIFATFVVFALSACGNGSTTTNQSDSTSTQLDSNAVSAADSTVAEIPTADSLIQTETKVN